jgi:hypothetical protein
MIGNEIGGIFLGNWTLKEEDGPYDVLEGIYVAEGAILVIEAGNIVIN